MEFLDKFKIWVPLICLICQMGHGFYHPGSYPPKYVVGEPLPVKDSAENFGELLIGDWIQNSPYKFNMYTNETEIFLFQTKSLTSDDYKLLTNRINEIYQVKLFLDDFPAIRYVKNYAIWTGYPIGLRFSDIYYIFNHLKFKVLVHKYEEMNVPGYTVEGFEVTPCSFQHNPESLKNLKTYGKYPSKINCEDNIAYMTLKENEPVAFTYEVTFIESDIKWPSRWVAYMEMDGAIVHWFSIMNSLMVITFLAGIILMSFLNTLLEPIKSLVKSLLVSTHLGF